MPTKDHPFEVWIQEYAPSHKVESVGDLMEDAAIQTWERVKVGIVLTSEHSFSASPFRTALSLKLAAMDSRIVVDKAAIADQSPVGLEDRVKELMTFTWNRCLDESASLFREESKDVEVIGKSFLEALEIFKYEEEKCKCGSGGCGPEGCGTGCRCN